MLSHKELELTRGYEVCCPNCHKKSPLSAWGFVQTYWYESPHGCTGGAEWWPQIDIMLCLIICPNSCLPEGANLATRIMDLPIQVQEKNRVFGFIQHVTRFSESALNQIFKDHYVQYGVGNDIKNSREERISEEEFLDF